MKIKLEKFLKKISAFRYNKGELISQNMVNQLLWVGIAVGVFFAGIGVSYAIFSSTYDPATMKFQNQELFDQMMSQNPKMSAQWMDTMGSPQMQQWMSDPQHAKEMAELMRTNHGFMMEMFGEMMNEPSIRLQLMGHMTDNPEMWSQMQEMMGAPMGGGMMGQMGPGMMSGFETSTQTIPSGDSQARTFDISMEEVEFMAEVVTDDGQQQFATVELHVWEPDLIIVNQGDTVTLNISNPRKHAHTFTIPDFGVNTKILEPREGIDSVTFVADKPGVFTFYCGLPYNPDKLYCDPDHNMMTGTLIVLE